MKNKELIIFDLDGTLIDTVPDLNKAVNYGLTTHGFPNVDLEHTRKAIGNGVAKLVERSVPKGTPIDVYLDTLIDFEMYYSEHAFDLTKPYEKIYEVTNELKTRGYRLAVSTNKLEYIATDLINKCFPNIFETVCGDDKSRAKKPAPDSINEIKKRLQIFDNSKIIYIGDTEVDYQTATNSNIDLVMVTYGYRTHNELKEKGVPTTVVANTPDDLLIIFN